MIQKRLPGSYVVVELIRVDQVVAVEVGDVVVEVGVVAVEGCDVAFVTGCRSTVSRTIVITMVSEININICKNAFTYRC